jgi:hypothetical protein
MYIFWIRCEVMIETGKYENDNKDWNRWRREQQTSSMMHSNLLLFCHANLTYWFYLIEHAKYLNEGKPCLKFPRWNFHRALTK